MNSSCRNRMRQGCHGARVTSRRTHTECYCLAIFWKHHKKQKKKVPLMQYVWLAPFLTKEKMWRQMIQMRWRKHWNLNLKKKHGMVFSNECNNKCHCISTWHFFGEHPLPPLGTHPLHVLVSGSEAHGTQPWPLALRCLLLLPKAI